MSYNYVEKKKKKMVEIIFNIEFPNLWGINFFFYNDDIIIKKKKKSYFLNEIFIN